MKSFDELWAELQLIQIERPAGSGTLAAIDAGVHTIGKKILEEAGEVWLAAEHEGNEQLAEEISHARPDIANGPIRATSSWLILTTGSSSITCARATSPFMSVQAN